MSLLRLACALALLALARGASCPGASPTAYTAFHDDVTVVGSLQTADEALVTVEPPLVRTRHLRPTGTASEGDACPEMGRLAWDAAIRRLLRCDGDVWILAEARPAVCGDGVLGSGETCDDANSADDDGCSSTCQTEDGFTCVSLPSVCSPTAP